MDIKLTAKDVRRIKQLRKQAKDLTAAQIAKRFKISTPYVYSIEHGRSRVAVAGGSRR